MKMIQKQPLTGRHKRPSSVRVGRQFAEVEVFGDDELHMVDLNMVEKVAKYRWAVNNRGYAMTRISGRTVYLHRFVFGSLSDGQEIDHRDRNKCNSRRSNLRAVTRGFNVHNGAIKGRSKFRGVYRAEGRQKWRAQITVDSNNRYLGSFANEEDAAHAYDEAAYAHYGVNAIVNFKSCLETQP